MKIKTCPHCGGKATLKRNYSKMYSTYFVFVQCDNCKAQGRTYSMSEDDDHTYYGRMEEHYACIDAVNAWNRRVAE